MDVSLLERQYTLVCIDGELHVKFEVLRESSYLSEKVSAVSNSNAEAEQKIVLDNRILKKDVMFIIIGLIEDHIQARKEKTSETDEDMDFVDLGDSWCSTITPDSFRGTTDEQFLSILIAADVLQLRVLFNFCKRHMLAQLVECESADEFREVFHITNNFDDDVKAKIEKENVWVAIAPTNTSTSTDNDMTYSVVVDKKESKSNVTREEGWDWRRGDGGDVETLPDNIIPLTRLRKPAKDLPDSAANSCTECDVVFGSYVRRHHCRACGRIVCDDCSSHSIALPPEYTKSFDSMVSSFTGYYRWIMSGFSSNLERVCDPCFVEVSEQIELEIFMKAFDLCEMDLPLLRRATAISVSWRNAAIYYLSALRQIQYTLSTHQFTNREKKLLWINRRYWVGHSKWIVRLMRIVDWSDQAMAMEALKLLHSQDAFYPDCWSTLCSRPCTREMGMDGVLELLSRTMVCPEVRLFAVQRLQIVDFPTLLLYMQTLVHDIRYEPFPDPSPLVAFLLEAALADKDVRVDLYWNLEVECESAQYSNRYRLILHRLIMLITEKFGSREVLEIIRGGDIMRACANTEQGGEDDDLQEVLAESFHKLESFYKLEDGKETFDESGLFRTIPLTLPIDPHLKVCNFYCKEAVVKRSATAPVIIPAQCLTGDRYKDYFFKDDPGENATFKYKLIYKREDIRKDRAVINVIRVMEKILKDHGLDRNLLTYRVVPTSTTDGFLECVQHATTLYDVERKMATRLSIPPGKTLQQHLFEMSGNAGWEEVKRNFMSTMSTWSVITLLLGVGDRHLNNIMVRDDGTFFHIDYGFILGKDPKIMMPRMRINEQMIGVFDEDPMPQILTHSAEVYECLRRHVGLFYSMLVPLVEADPVVEKMSEFDLERELSERFLPGYSKKEAEVTLNKWISESRDYFGTIVNDELHCLAQEGTLTRARETASAGISSVATTVTGFFGSVFSLGG